MDNKQLTSDNKYWTIGNGQRTTDNGQRMTERLKLTMNDYQQTTYDMQPWELQWINGYVKLRMDNG